MNIGCDLDGVIIDHRKNERRLVKKRGIRIPRTMASRIDIKNFLTPVQYEDMRKELYGAYSLGAEKIAGAGWALRRLLQDGHMLQIISRRHPKSRRFARLWLHAHGFQDMFPESRIHFIAAGDSKEALCKKLDIQLYIDDWDFELRSLVTPRYKVLFGSQIKKPFAGVIGVPDWGTLVRFIKKIS